jgi:hypothetical protein
MGKGSERQPEPWHQAGDVETLGVTLGESLGSLGLCCFVCKMGTQQPHFTGRQRWNTGGEG